ncbi:MAG: DUF2852 domain-containing protein [Methylobacteriaceae bacterium]|nr:DUF2852 domain-containing protein [Rhodoblastus sp.]MCC0004042.1 DUF2852 domain-containing protein [Methylobacteriaceae bacterium]
MSVYQGTIDGSAHSGERRSRRVRWRGVELFAMILGFIVFWPIGLAILFLKVWQKREGRPDQDLVDFVHERGSEMRGRCMAKRTQWSAADWGRSEWKPFSGPRPTGNSAFDDWRAAELARLEEERQKLVQAERDFAEHLDKLRRARDREEFDRFMNERRAQQQGPGDPAAQI